MRCRYEDCSSKHPIATDDEQVTCPRCRDDLGLPILLYFEVQFKLLGVLSTWRNRETTMHLKRAAEETMDAQLSVNLEADADEGAVTMIFEGLSLARCIQVFEAEMRRPLSSLAGYRQIETEE